MGDLSGLVHKIQEVMNPNQQQQIVPKIVEGGTFTLRLMYEMFQSLQSMGPLGQVSYPFIAIMCLNTMKLSNNIGRYEILLQVFSMIPGFSAQFIEKGKEKEGQAKIKRYMTMMDSMTDAGELLQTLCLG